MTQPSRPAHADRPVLRTLRQLFGMVLVAVALAGCAGVTRTPAPKDLYFKARVPDFPDARFFGDKPLPDHAFDAAAWRTNRFDLLKPFDGQTGPLSPHVLLLSGGGPDGAFGAGLLNGWSVFGDRPEFEIVTGVSIGALMAPFAFLGAEYDPQLRAMFLDRRGIDDIVRVNILGSVLVGALAVGDSTPLKLLIERYVDEALLDAIAAEHRKGRRLFVGTTNLDAKRPITWNMGAIAASGRPGRLKLFRDVLKASAAIPGLTPPVYIDVQLNGRRYQEMHVDGGVMNSLIFAVPALTLKRRTELFGDIMPTLWIIQNNKLRADYRPAADSLGGVVGETISELIRAQSRGDQARLFFIAERERYRYRLAAVPKAFDAPGGDNFDPRYLRRLFMLGEEMGRKGYPWRSAPSSILRLDLVEEDEVDQDG